MLSFFYTTGVFYIYSTSNFRLDTFQVLNSYMWPMAMILDRTVLDNNNIFCMTKIKVQGSSWGKAYMFPTLQRTKIAIIRIKAKG